MHTSGRVSKIALYIRTPMLLILKYERIYISKQHLNR